MILFLTFMMFMSYFYPQTICIIAQLWRIQPKFVGDARRDVEVAASWSLGPTVI